MINMEKQNEETHNEGRRGPGRPIKQKTFAELQAAEKSYMEKTRARRAQLREAANLPTNEEPRRARGLCPSNPVGVASSSLDLTNRTVIRTGKKGRPALDLTPDERAQYKRDQKRAYRARASARRKMLKEDAGDKLK